MDLQTIKDCLADLETLSKRRAELEAEQTSLTIKVPKLKAAVAEGAKDRVGELSIARERLETMPGALQGVEQSRINVMARLRTEVSGLYGEIQRAAGAENARVQSEVTAFLKTFTDDVHMVEDFARQIANKSRKAMALEAQSASYSATGLSHAKDHGIISRARFALENFNDV